MEEGNEQQRADHPASPIKRSGAAARDDFPIATRGAVARRVAYRCSNPECPQITSGPHDGDQSKATSIGVAAHIRAASRGGPRYDAAMTSEQRKSPLNAIWLCQNCAKLIDSDPARYTAERLHGWKQHAEDVARCELEGPRHRDRSRHVVSAESVRPILTFEGTAKYVPGPQNYGDLLVQGVIRNIGGRPAMEPTFFLGVGKPLPLDPLGPGQRREVSLRVPVGVPQRYPTPLKMILEYRDVAGAHGSTDLIGAMGGGAAFQNVTHESAELPQAATANNAAIRRELLDRVKRHISQLRPLLLQGVIDPQRWHAANQALISRCYENDINLALGNDWPTIMATLHQEEMNIGVQATLLDKYSAKMTDGEENRALDADRTNREYNELTRQVIAETLTAYVDVLMILGDEQLGRDYARTAAQFREAALRHLSAIR